MKSFFVSFILNPRPYEPIVENFEIMSNFKSEIYLPVFKNKGTRLNIYKIRVICVGP